MVGAAGLILTQVMCDGMNRSLVSVLFGGALGSSAVASGGGGEYTNITSCILLKEAFMINPQRAHIDMPMGG